MRLFKSLFSPRSPSPDTTKKRGDRGEEVAATHLRQKGYRIIERNWRPLHAQRGEIDCIAWHRDQRGRKILCFVEVKTRSSNRMGTPQSAVNAAKQRQLSRLANSFLAERRWRDVACRFDVVEVWIDGASSPRVALHQNAFDYQE